MPGLTSAQRTLFDAGLVAFEREFTAAEGLGPVFNDVSCVACHGVPTPGGASTRTVTRLARDSPFVALAHPGGPLLQELTIEPAGEEVTPPEA